MIQMNAPGYDKFKATNATRFAGGFRMKLDNSVVAIVTGGASGLGEATARALAGGGVRVAIFDLNEDRGRAVAAEISGYFCKVDVTSDASTDEAFAASRRTLGQERILVNCAGGGTPGKLIRRDKSTGKVTPMPFETFSKIVALNLFSAFLCSSKAAAGMTSLPEVDGERGVIINTASAAAQDGQIGQVAYSAGKAGIVGMTLPIARDLSSEGIRINTIMPGIFATPLMNTLGQNVIDSLAASVPFPKRLGQPAEFASLAVELCRNGYINGETIRVDGAIRLPPR
jgi:NAD(P)-dependent dehydrogenase (short-subunit alcohol dehydrogenase family)